MATVRCACLLLVVAVVAGCTPAAPDPTAATTSAPAGAEALVVTDWELPSPAVAAQPDLVATADGGLLLSWLTPQEDGHALEFARHADGRWSAPQRIASGDDWFVNWADTPHLAATADGALWAHWLRKSAAATYAYDVVLARSGDGGGSWSPPVTVNDDGTASEHGFVSMWAAGGDRLGIAWLDGRDTVAAPHAHGGEGAAAMTLRSALFDAGLGRSGEVVVDAAVCDCCQTAVAVTTRGPILAYRDRSDSEIRDIRVARRQAGEWHHQGRVHADDWRMPACPVNGPALAARGNRVLAGWYTAPADTPLLRLAVSADAGRNFGAPRQVDAGDAVQGRVQVAFAGGDAWVAWLREDRGGQSLQLARYRDDLSAELGRTEVARLRGRGRGTGLPRMLADGDSLRLVWTDVVDGTPRLQGATVTVGADPTGG